MTTDTFDVILIGAGHNGLVCSDYLARAGFKVLILEAGKQAGGASITRGFSEGFSVSACAHSLSQLHPDIVRDLNLEAHGLEYAAKNLKTIALSEDGNHLSILADTVEGANLGTAEKQKYRDFHHTMKRFAGVLANMVPQCPPKLVEGDLADKFALLKLGLGIRLLGKNDMRELMRIATINIFDVLQEHFDNPLLKGAISFDAVLGAHMGPRSPNTVLGYLHRQLSGLFGFDGPALPRGGMGAVTRAIADAAMGNGVDIRLSCPVKQIKIEQGRAVGVVMQDGSEFSAAIIVSNADPKTTFRDLVTYPKLDSGFCRRVENIRIKSDTAKLHIALDALPDFAGLSDIGDRMIIAPDPVYVERAFDHSKYGEYSSAPAMEILVPTVHDSNLAPPGKHVMSIVVQYAPYSLKTGWDSSSKQAFSKIIVDRLAHYAPGLPELIIDSELLTPKDIEQEFRISGGHWHHCELALDQIAMMRPAYGATRYNTPIKGLYLCGAGSHPGGNVMGMAGKNSATAIIKGR